MRSHLAYQRINIGLVGLNFGRLIVDQLQSEPASKFFHLQAVCDLDEAKAADFGNRLGIPYYTDLEMLLADETVKIIGLFTGPSKRADLLQRIIRAGKDVITTKPFELDPAAAREVLEEAQSLGRLIFLNSPPPQPPGWLRRVQEWHKEYNLGQPVSCRAEVVVSYREKADGRWYDDPIRCPAAPIFRLGIYPINDLVRLFGSVQQVHVMSTRLFTCRPTPDNTELTLVFKNRALGSIYASFCIDDGQFYANSFILHYERGTIYRNIKTTAYGKAHLTSRLHLIAKKGESEVVTEDEESLEPSGNYPWEAFYDLFTEANRRTVLMPIDDIVHGIEVIAAMARAEQSGKPETV